MDVHAITPIERHGGYLVKRDDLYRVAGRSGGKVRTCWHLATMGGTLGLVTAGSRHSPQVNIVAGVAAALGVPCAVHVPAGPLGPEVEQARDAGAEVHQHSPGHNSVIVARARTMAAERGWTLIPFGMECAAAVALTAVQAAAVPSGDVGRVVVPVGSGMTLAGVLSGLAAGVSVLGVRVGADPVKRLDRWCPLWRMRPVELVGSDLRYDQRPAVTRLGGLDLDPIYEAKCLPFLRAGDLLWVVGHR